MLRFRHLLIGHISVSISNKVAVSFSNKFNLTMNQLMVPQTTHVGVWVWVGARMCGGCMRFLYCVSSFDPFTYLVMISPYTVKSVLFNRLCSHRQVLKCCYVIINIDIINEHMYYMLNDWVLLLVTILQHLFYERGRNPVTMKLKYGCCPWM